MGVDVGTATGYLDLDITGFLNGLKTAQSEAGAAADNMVTKIGNKMNTVGNTFTSVGSTLTKTVTTPVIALGTAITKVSSDFESSMSKVKAISGATGEDFEKLKEKAQEMGAKTKFSASESAEAFQYMAMAGWDVESMLGGISGVMNLAAASGENLGTVSDIVTDAMTAFGLSSKETSKVLKDGVMVEVDNTTRFVDALAAASNSSNTNVAMLGESFKYVAPVAGAMGFSIEDTAIALGLMANQGIKASQSGTALRTILTNMANPTDKMIGAMDALGVSLTNTDGSAKTLMEIMLDMRKGFGEGHLSAEEFSQGMLNLQNRLEKGEIKEKDYIAAVEELTVAMYGAEGAQAAQVAAQLAGKEGMAALLAIVNTAEEDFDNLADSIYNASGTSQEMADVMIDNLAGQMTILKSSVEGIALQFGEILLPRLKEVVAWVQDLSNRFSELDQEQKEQIVKWATIAASIGPVLMVLGKLTSGVGSVLSVLGKIPKLITGVGNMASTVGSAFGAISLSAAAAAVVIAGLVAAFVDLYNNNIEFRDRITSIWRDIRSEFEGFGQGIVDRLNALGFDFENLTEVLKSAWQGFTELLAPIFIAAFERLSDVISQNLAMINGVLDIFIGVFTGNWEQVWGGVKGIFKSTWEFIKSTFENQVQVVTGVADVFLKWFGTSWDEVWTGVKEFFFNTWTGIKTFFEDIGNGIKEFAANTWNAIKNNITIVYNAISSYLSTIWITIYNNISNTVSNIYNSVINTFNMLRDGINNIINAIKNFLINTWNTIKANVVNIANNIKQLVSQAFDGLKLLVTNSTTNAKNTIVNTWNSLKNSVSNIANNLKTSVSNTFNSLKTSISNSMNTAKQLAINAMTNAKNGVVRVWDNITNTFYNIGRNIIQGIINGISSMVRSLYDAIESALSDLVDEAKDALGIESPSKVMRDQIGKWLPPGIAQGFGVAMVKATKDMQESLDEGISSLDGDGTGVSIGNNLTSIASTVAEYFEALEQRLATSVENMRSTLEYLISTGTDIVSGVSMDYIGYNGMSDSGSRDGADDNDVPTRDGGGSRTYIFNTTKAIDEIEAARQMMRAERDMAEGFA